MSASAIVGFLDRVFYPGVGTNWDDVLLRETVLRESSKAERLLDLGAGAGIVRQMDFREIGAAIFGMDLEPRIALNPYLRHRCIADAERLPYADGSFDAVVADNVLEHLRDPQKVFCEVRRVLRPGGLFHFKTPNRKHYVPQVARLTPHWFHRLVARAKGRRGEDTFVTHYRANSPEDVTRLAANAGLAVEQLRLVEGRPEYCRINPVLYVGGILYERLVNASELFASFRVVLIGTLRRV